MERAESVMKGEGDVAGHLEFYLKSIKKEREPTSDLENESKYNPLW